VGMTIKIVYYLKMHTGVVRLPLHKGSIMF